MTSSRLLVIPLKTATINSFQGVKVTPVLYGNNKRIIRKLYRQDTKGMFYVRIKELPTEPTHHKSLFIK